MTTSSRLAVAILAASLTLSVAGVAYAVQLSDWAAAQKIDTIGGNHADLNTPSQDGCPIQSPDGLSLYIASNRPGGKGGLDIWMASRASTTAPWGAPQNLGEPVNSGADDFCPTPVGQERAVLREPRAVAGSLRAGRHVLHPPHRRGLG